MPHLGMNTDSIREINEVDQEHSQLDTFKREVQRRCVASEDLYEGLPRTQDCQERRASSSILRREQSPSHNRQRRMGDSSGGTHKKEAYRCILFREQHIRIQTGVRRLRRLLWKEDMAFDKLVR